MAQAIERGILEGMHTIVEAGTGVGKSLAYLVPAIRSGKKVVLSTGTIALQEQLVRKDIPLVERRARPADARHAAQRALALPLPPEARTHARRPARSRQSRSMQQIWEWAERTQSGDRAELSFLPRGDEWEQLDADADECTGEICPHFRDCFFFKKRDEAKYADLVVVNHALFFLDLAMGGGLLPPYDVAVLDEAHQCERWATDALTAVVSRATDRSHAAQAAPPLPPAARASKPISKRRCGGSESSLAQVPSERYPLAANEEVWEPLDALRAMPLSAWRTGSSRTGSTDSNAAPITRPKPNAGAIWRCVRCWRTSRDRTLRSRCRRRHRLGRAQRCRRPLLRELRAARGRRISARAALCANAQRRADQRDAGDGPILRVFATDAGRRRRARARRAVALRLRSAGASLYRARRGQSEIDRTSPGAPRRSSKSVSTARGGRAFVLFTSYARLREVHALVRERLAFPVRMQGDLPTFVSAWIGSGARRAPCSSQRARFGRASTSSAMRSRASSSTGCPFRRRAIRW